MSLLLSNFLVAQTISSPSGEIKLKFGLSEKGIPGYSVNYLDKEIVGTSGLGFELKELGDFYSNFEILNFSDREINEVWSPVMGEQSEIVNHCTEATFFLKQKETNRLLNIIVRVFNEGVAFRYEFPKQTNLNYFIISDELTSFQMNGDHKTFWIPGDFDSQEYVYLETKISEIDMKKVDLNNGIGFKTFPKTNIVQSPLMMKSKEGIYINIFEAALDNYPVMHLSCNTATKTFSSTLVPNAIGDKAYLQAPCKTPWRTIMISNDARVILSSKMTLNLNEPCKIEDVSYIKPMKYVGIWWEMHIGKSTWDYAGSQNAQNDGTLVASGLHGATTERTKFYIDFAAANGFDGVLVEGWNVGWEDWFGNWKEEVFDFTTPYPDFNIQEISEYAKSKGIKMIMHHETSGSAGNYERHLDRAFQLMVDFGYPAVKTGYVGKIIPRGEHHDGQAMVNHYHHVVKRAADNRLMVNSHESSRPTGMNRTYPNYIAAEAARGNEFNAWSIGNPPAHETILPFTRLLGGPMDYTPGIFEIKIGHYKDGAKEQVHTTLAKQLALYVTMYSPLQMAADLPENYIKYSDAFQFIKDVGIDWEKSIYLEAEPGDYITVVRKEKNTEDWFLGAITDENARTTELALSFLEPGVKYNATIYEDGKDASWNNNPMSYKISTVEVTSKSKLTLALASGGGAAVRFARK